MKKYTKILGVIPVRKGSVRLKYKNFLKFGKKNLTELTIDLAIKSRIFSKIVVSSDNKNLEKLCKKKKVDFFYRKNFCDNKSPVSLATLDTIRSMNLEKNYDVVVQLMATCPLRISEDIINSVNSFLKYKKKFQISVFSCEWIKENYIIINDKNRYSKYDKDGYDDVEFSTPNRLGYIDFKYKRGIFTKEKEYKVDFFHNETVSFIEVDFNGEKLKIHNPLEIMDYKLNMAINSKVYSSTSRKHNEDLTRIFGQNPWQLSLKGELI